MKNPLGLPRGRGPGTTTPPPISSSDPTEQQRRNLQQAQLAFGSPEHRPAQHTNRLLSTPPSRTTTPERRPSTPIVVRPRHIPITVPRNASSFPLQSDAPPTSNDGSSTLDASPAPSLRQAPVMSRPPTGASRTSTLDSSTSAPSPSQIYAAHGKWAPSNQTSGMNSSQTSLSHLQTQDLPPGQDNTAQTQAQSQNSESREPVKAAATPAVPTTTPSPAVKEGTPNIAAATPTTTSTSLSGLVCNVHRTTGQEPHPLVGATTTVLGDKLYVFGGRILSRTRPQLTADLYELDLIRRHWTKIETKGTVPPPRYFHSVCALGDSKLVCYGGMSPAAPSPPPQPSTANSIPPPANAQDPQPEVVVMSDIHIYDVPSQTWQYVSTQNTPQGRYAHCATILSSSAIFTSTNAPLSAITHNPRSTDNPNQGSIGVSLDGAGGAEMVIVGGQDSANHYIEQISVFNLRSLKWIATDPLTKSCGAYRSVVAPLDGMPSVRIGKGINAKTDLRDGRKSGEAVVRDAGSSMLIYSNYNFLDVKLELQVRLPDGTLTEKPMRGDFSPPGLRFPNGGIIDHHFVVSGTFLTSSKQEYALWALDLRNLTWSRIDAGGNHFTQGSWNRGVLWKRRNTFVVLGNRKRSLVEDYNHRRINFSNICLVELEAFGMYDNPRRVTPMSGYISASGPVVPPFYRPSNRPTWTGGGRAHSAAAEELGKMALALRELADMDLLAMGGERIPVNSRVIAKRWGPYFVQLLREGATAPDSTDSNTLHATRHGAPSRNSSITITPSIGASSTSTATTLTMNNVGSHSGSSYRPSSAITPISDNLSPPTTQSVPPTTRPRTLYLPHTHLTLQTLVYFLYTSSLPSPQHPLCTPQILCSLLQLARPYQIDGLLESVIERLHQMLDGRNAAAIFNAAAMAAGGGRGTGSGGLRQGLNSRNLAATQHEVAGGESGLTPPLRGLKPRPRHNGAGPRRRASSAGHSDAESDLSSTASTTASTRTDSSDYDLSDTGLGGEREIWSGEVSAVVGLQKRGLRGLMEGRRLRERGRSTGAGPPGERSGDKVGLGIA